MPQRNRDQTLTPAQRLKSFIRWDQVIPFELDAPSRAHPYIKFSIFGAVTTNELYVRLSNGRRVFVAAVASPLVAPAMADRRFGIDVLDQVAAIQLAETLWKAHSSALIISRP